MVVKGCKLSELEGILELCSFPSLSSWGQHNLESLNDMPKIGRLENVKKKKQKKTHFGKNQKFEGRNEQKLKRLRADWLGFLEENCFY